MVVQEKHSGTIDDPIPWVYNSILENGKYYIDKEIKYLCIRDSGIPLAYENLADCISRIRKGCLGRNLLLMLWMAPVYLFMQGFFFNTNSTYFNIW